MTALVVDDVTDLRMLYRMVLEGSERFVVVAEAGDGVAAVELAQEHQPELVLLDVSMPVVDGLEALPRILEASPASQVVMLTGFNSDRLASAARKLGAVGYLEKGLTPEQLVAQLLTIMGASAAGGQPPTVPTARSNAIPEAAMLSVLAHEIRNPLTAIHGLAATLDDQWGQLDSTQARDIAGRIASNTRYLDGVVRSLLTLGSLESGDALLELTDRDPVELVDELLRLLRDEHSDRRLEARIVGRPERVLVDAQRFRQVLSNLVANADRYSPEGTPVTITVQPDSHGVLVCVTDEGPGIPHEDHEQVFDRFVRRHTGGRGVGLGLYICRLLMTAMDGEIWIADSAVGTRVCCRLPSPASPSLSAPHRRRQTRPDSGAMSAGPQRGRALG